MKRQDCLPPCVVVLSGLPLSGKTTLAKKITAVSNLINIDVDVIREEIDETRKKDPSVKWLSPNEEKEIMKKSYSLLCKRAKDMVLNKQSVILSGTFSRLEFKKPLEEFCLFLQTNEIPFIVFLLTTKDDAIEERIKKRNEEGNPSNINSLEKYRWAQTIFEPITFVPLVKIDTTDLNHIDQILIHFKWLFAKD